MTKTKNQAASVTAERRAEFERIMRVAEERGYDVNWVPHRYQQLFGAPLPAAWSKEVKAAKNAAGPDDPRRTAHGAAELVQAARASHFREATRALASVSVALDEHDQGKPSLAEARANLTRAFAALADGDGLLESAMKDLGMREPLGVEPIDP